jgi:predicted TIM-barrel fold metal-dependent hydrolase
MKEPSEKEELLADVMGSDEELRAATLQKGLMALRRRRRLRKVRTLVLALAPLAGAAALIFARQWPHREIAQGPVRTAQTNRVIAGTAIGVLTDEELLALFKGRPVALIGSPGRQRLVLFDEPER